VVRRVDRALVPDGVPTEVRGARAVAEETRLFTQRTLTRQQSPRSIAITSRRSRFSMNWYFS